MKSIMHKKTDHTCYLCKKLYYDNSFKSGLHEHHVFDGPNRKLSEHFGLKVYLCLNHHTSGKEAVHNNIKNMRIIQEDGQRAFEKKYPDLNFRELFGRNYL